MKNQIMESKPQPQTNEPKISSSPPLVLSQYHAPEHDWSFVKTIVLTVFSIAAIILFWVSVRAFLLEFSGSHLVSMAAFSALFLVAFLLQSFLVHEHTLFSIAVFLESFLPIVFFYEEFSKAAPVVGLAFSVFFIFLGYGAYASARVRKNSIKPDFFLISRKAIVKAVTGLLISFFIFAYLYYVRLGAFTEELGRRAAHEALRVSAPVTALFIPAFSPDEPVGEVLRRISEFQVQNFNLFQKEKAVPAASRAELIEAGKEALEAGIRRVTDSYDEKKSVGDFTYELVREVYELRIPDELKNPVGIGFFAFLFFALRGATVFIYWIVELAAYLIFKIFLLTKLVKIETYEESRQIARFT